MKAMNFYGGYVVNRIGRYKIIEGVGPSGGDWAAKGRGELVILPSRAEAEEHAHLSEETR